MWIGYLQYAHLLLIQNNNGKCLKPCDLSLYRFVFYLLIVYYEEEETVNGQFIQLQKNRRERCTTFFRMIEQFYSLSHGYFKVFQFSIFKFFIIWFMIHRSLPLHFLLFFFCKATRKWKLRIICRYI